MTLYFFDVIVGEKVFADDVGSELPSLQDAEREAVLGAREQIAMQAKAGIDVAGYKFRVRTEAGTPAFEMLFGAALRKP